MLQRIGFNPIFADRKIKLIEILFHDDGNSRQSFFLYLDTTKK